MKKRTNNHDMIPIDEVKMKKEQIIMTLYQCLSNLYLR